MAIYIMFTTLTDEGRKTLKANPQRIKEVNNVINELVNQILEKDLIIAEKQALIDEIKLTHEIDMNQILF